MVDVVAVTSFAVVAVPVVVVCRGGTRRRSRVPERRGATSKALDAVHFELIAHADAISPVFTAARGSGDHQHKKKSASLGTLHYLLPSW